MRGGPLHTVYYKFFSDTPSRECNPSCSSDCGQPPLTRGTCFGRVRATGPRAHLTVVSAEASDVTAHNVESCLRRAGKLGDDTHISGIEVETFGLQEDGKPKGLVSEIVRVTCTFEVRPSMCSCWPP